MKNTHNLLTCLFGHHDYSDELTRDTDGHEVHLCKICKRSGYYKWAAREETWTDYDVKGNRVHSKWADGAEYWYDYDEKGNWIYERRSSGHEFWLDNNGRSWTTRKPKNWKYENVKKREKKVKK